MTRPKLLACLRFTGYHSDRPLFTQLYMGHRIQMLSAQRAYREGESARLAGVRCTCVDCEVAP